VSINSEEVQSTFSEEDQKPATDWDPSGNPGAVQIADGLAAKLMRRADLNPAADLFVFRLFAVSLRILFATHAHRNASNHAPQLKLSKRRKKIGGVTWG